MELSIILPIFAPKYKVMEEKRYPILDEEDGQYRVCEPVASVEAAPKSVDGVTTVHDWIDDLDWSRFPSFGPFSEEEAVARIVDFEKRQAKGEVKWYTSEEVDKELYERFPWLR